MMIASVREALKQEVGLILQAPEDYGLPRRGDASLKLIAILEPLVASQKFLFLTIDDLAEALQDDDLFIVFSDFVRLRDARAPRPLSKPTQHASDEFFLGGEVLPTGTETRLYDRHDSALAVVGAVRQTLEGIRLWCISRAQVVATGGRITVFRYGVGIGTRLIPEIVREIPRDLTAKWVAEVLYSIRLQETLYLNHEASQADAAEFLYESKPPEIVESDLVRHLADPDRDVRMNVLAALGTRAYRVEFAPGKPLMPRDERLEESLLRPETVKQIAKHAMRETDPGVLDHFACTLKSQSYLRSLSPVASDVRSAVLQIMPKVKSQQTIKDLQELLRSLR